MVFVFCCVFLVSFGMLDIRLYRAIHVQWSINSKDEEDTHKTTKKMKNCIP